LPSPLIIDFVGILPNIKANIKQVIIKITAEATVILCIKVVPPVAPKSVWLEPPKTEPMLAPFPFWSNTITINAILTTMCTKITRALIIFLPLPLI